MAATKTPRKKSTPTNVDANGAAPAAEPKAAKKLALVIPELEMRVMELRIVGTSTYVQNAFSAKAREMMRATQEAGDIGAGTPKRDPKDFQACYEGALHRGVDREGNQFFGIPAPAFRNAMIAACRLADTQMTRAKLALFVLADGACMNDGTPLVRFAKGEPRPVEHIVILPNGSPDVRVRAAWSPGWEMLLRVEFDATSITPQSIVNLLARAGRQVGVGEGRPFSKKSAGMGWGCFELIASE